MNQLQKIESKAMKRAFLMFCFMAALGITVYQFSNSVAILIDGVFSLISAVTTLIAIKVSSLLVKKDEKYPFGFAGYESLYILLRAVLLLVTVLMALLDCVAKIYTYAVTRNIPVVNANVFMVYVLFIAMMYVLLNKLYKHYGKLTNDKSELLMAEKFNAQANSYLMVGVGASFLLIGLLKFTPLQFLVPISDSIIVFLIAVMVIVDTTKLLINTVKTLGGKGISGLEKEELEQSLNSRVQFNFKVSNLRIQKLGKTAYVTVDMHISSNSCTAKEITASADAIRQCISTHYEFNYAFVNVI